MNTAINSLQRLTQYFVFLCVTFLLTACGGGDSGSGGGQQPVANINQLAGTYKGTVTQRITTPQGAATGSAPVTINIRQDGTVGGSIQAPTVNVAVCDPLPPLVVTSNPLFWSNNLTNCAVAGSAALCSGTSQGNAQISGNKLTAQTTMRINCPTGSAALVSNYNATRT